MPTDKKKSVAQSAKQLVIPAELLKSFKGDIRIFPSEPHPNGYITFDKEMLISVLEHGTDMERRELVSSLKNLGKAGGELVILQH